MIIMSQEFSRHHHLVVVLDLVTVVVINLPTRIIALMELFRVKLLLVFHHLVSVRQVGML